MIVLALAFGNPGVLWLAFAIPMFWWIRRNEIARREERLTEDIGARSPWLAGTLDHSRENLRSALWCVALGALVVALAEPRHGVAIEGAQTPTIDVVVCLDVSRSMRARDVEPDRLGFAHAALSDLCTHARGDRFGLVAFAGEARLVVPLTEDLGSYAELLRTTDEISVERGGTDLAAALSTALAALESAGHDDADARAAAILLVTDGEDLAGQGLALAETYKKRGIPIHCLGLGSALGSKIPVENARGDEIFVKDRSGEDVITRLDAVFLETLAKRSGGSFRATAVAESDILRRLYDDELRPSARAAGRSSSVDRGARPRWQIPVALAFLTALAAMLLGRRRTLKPRLGSIR